jgi:hypothetical protein
MSAHDDLEDPLVAELRDLFAEVDPVPALVVEVAKASLGWRRLDGDLAELLADSVLDSEQLAGTRGGAPVRSVSFKSPSMTIDLEVHPGDETQTLLGQISPPAPLDIEVQAADGTTVASARSDELGRFRASLASRGTIRLLLGAERTAGAAAVQTSWITV